MDNNEHSTNLAEVGTDVPDINVGELISRQAALEWCLEGLNNMPSAQPEIVRCKDCKHRDPEDKKCDCGHDIEWQLPRGDYWYCADGERREVTT